MNSYHCYFLIRSYSALPYLDRCLHSVFKQSNQEFTVLFVDDCSEYTRDQKKNIRNMLKGHIVVFNSERKFSVRNAYEMIGNYVEKKHSIILNLDGDDWLVNKNAVHIVQNMYKKNDCILTYGNCYYHHPGHPDHFKLPYQIFPHLNQRYSLEVEQQVTYRKHFLRPIHLRTWLADSFHKIPKEYFQRSNRDWLKFCEDQAIMLPLLEISKGRYQVIDTILSAYNLENPLNDFNNNLSERLIDEVTILKKKPLLL